MRNRFRLLTIFTVGALFAACGGDPTGTNSGDELADDEIQALFNELAASFAVIDAGAPALSLWAGAPYAAPQAAPVPLNASFSQSVGCESGTISIDGSVDGQIDDETFEGSMSMDFTWDFHSCAITTSGGTTITVDGAPQIDFAGDFTFGQTEFSASGTETGGFSFTASDGRAGSCAIDLSFESSVNTGTNTVSNSVSGTVCGRSADSFAFSPTT